MAGSCHSISKQKHNLRKPVGLIVFEPHFNLGNHKYRINVVPRLFACRLPVIKQSLVCSMYDTCMSSHSNVMSIPCV